jgi:lipoprotein-anchoring transpeptidase ErfK/SrfK
MGPRNRIAAAIVAAAAVLLTGCSALTGVASDPGAPDASSSSGSAPAVAGRSVAHRPATTPCTKNRQAQWILVSLKRQHMWMCERGRVAKDVPITSGMVGEYTATPTGRFRIQGLNRNTTLTLNTGATYPVKFWIPFDAPLFGFHDSSWQDFPYGSAKYKTDGSHGCVHVPLAAIRFMYRWADVGTPLTIR